LAQWNRRNESTDKTNKKFKTEEKQTKVTLEKLVDLLAIC
jgi:hypothetical protein